MRVKGLGAWTRRSTARDTQHVYHEKSTIQFTLYLHSQ